MIVGMSQSVITVKSSPFPQDLKYFHVYIYIAVYIYITVYSGLKYSLNAIVYHWRKVNTYFFNIVRSAIASMN